MPAPQPQGFHQRGGGRDRPDAEPARRHAHSCHRGHTTLARCGRGGQIDSRGREGDGAAHREGVPRGHGQRGEPLFDLARVHARHERPGPGERFDGGFVAREAAQADGQVGDGLVEVDEQGCPDLLLREGDQLLGDVAGTSRCTAKVITRRIGLPGTRGQALHDLTPGRQGQLPHGIEPLRLA